MTPRVGLLAYGLDRSPGGIGRYTRELGRHLGETGITLLTLSAGRSVRDGVVSLPGAGRLPALLTLGQAQVAAVARQRQLDLIHDPTGTAPLALVRARRVVTIHDAIPYVYPSTSTALDRLIYRTWLPWIAPRVDMVITVTQHARSEVTRYLSLDPDRVAVVYPGVGAEFRPQSPEAVHEVLARHDIGFPYILYVGAIEARKNLPRLLEAFARLRMRNDQARLVVVGARKWKFSPIFETVRRLGLESTVHFTGYVDDSDLPALYAGARLFVFPSLHEGFGLPVLEAMACGAPVVTSATSSLPEVAGDAALLIDPYDAEGLAVAMERVLNDGELATMLRDRGLARARRFSWPKTAAATLSIYQEVLDRPVRAPVPADG